jgi:hypothetical protein
VALELFFSFYIVPVLASFLTAFLLLYFIGKAPDPELELLESAF